MSETQARCMDGMYEPTIEEQLAALGEPPDAGPEHRKLPWYFDPYCPCQFCAWNRRYLHVKHVGPLPAECHTCTALDGTA